MPLVLLIALWLFLIGWFALAVVRHLAREFRKPHHLRWQ
jgi:hypothetical protein